MKIVRKFQFRIAVTFWILFIFNISMNVCASERETIKITNNDSQDTEPLINDNGYIVWENRTIGNPSYNIYLYNPDKNESHIINDGEFVIEKRIDNQNHVACFKPVENIGALPNKNEVFFFDGHSYKQLTDTDPSRSNKGLKISNSGHVFWLNFLESPFSYTTYFGTGLWGYDGNMAARLSEEFTQNTPLPFGFKGYQVWSDDHSFPYQKAQVYLYNGSDVKRVTHDPEYTNLYAVVNEKGQIAWCRGEDYTRLAEIFFYDGVTMKKISDNHGRVNSPRINVQGQVVWYGWDGSNYEIFFYDGKKTKKISHNPGYDYSPQINDQGYIVWEGEDTSWDDWEIFLYDGKAIEQLTDNSVKSLDPQINNRGDVVWMQFDGSDYEIYLSKGKMPLSPVINLLLLK